VGMSQLQEAEECIIYSVGTNASSSSASRHADSYSPYSSLHQDPQGMHLSKQSCSPGLVIVNCGSLTTLHSPFPAASLPARPCRRGLIRSFYAPLDTSDYDKYLDYWDPRQTWQRAHIKPYRIAGFDAHGTGDKPKTYTLDSLMQKNGELIMVL
jgi:hypothetical protein